MAYLYLPSVCTMACDSMNGNHLFFRFASATPLSIVDPLCPVVLEVPVLDQKIHLDD